MSFLDKFTQLIKNVSGESVGNQKPIDSINQMIRELEAKGVQLRSATTAAVMQRKLLEKQIKRQDEDVQRLQNKATEALQKGEEVIAKQILVNKKTQEKITEQLNEQLAELSETAESLKSELFAFENFVQEMRHKRETLMAKKIVAETQLNRQETHRSSSGFVSPQSIIAGFEEFEKEVNEKEAYASAIRELQSEMTNSEKGPASEIDKELAELKKRIVELESQKKK